MYGGEFEQQLREIIWKKILRNRRYNEKTKDICFKRLITNARTAKVIDSLGIKLLRRGRYIFPLVKIKTGKIIQEYWY